MYPSLRNAKHTAIFFPLLFDHTTRGEVYKRSERQQGKFPEHGRASVVISCKKETEEQLSTSATQPEFMRKRSMQSTSLKEVEIQIGSIMQACHHTKVVLLSIVRMQVLAAVPLLFTALHMYSPSSSGKVSGR